MKRKVLALFAVIAAILFLTVGQAQASTVSYSGRAMAQYVPNHWPLIALVDHTSQNPNWYHVRDSGFSGWNDPIGTTVNQYSQFQITDSCSSWPNRVCVEIVERDMSVNQTVDGCSAPGSPTVVGFTCRYASVQNGPVTRVVIIMASNQHGQPITVRVAATRHEIGHAYGLQHVTDPAYLMYPTTDGNPEGPRGDESGCVFQVYNAPPCSAGQAFARSQSVSAPDENGYYLVSTDSSSVR